MPTLMYMSLSTKKHMSFASMISRVALIHAMLMMMTSQVQAFAFPPPPPPPGDGLGGSGSGSSGSAQNSVDSKNRIWVQVTVTINFIYYMPLMFSEHAYVDKFTLSATSRKFLSSISWYFRWTIIDIILLVVVVLAVAVGGFFCWRRSRKTLENQQAAGFVTVHFVTLSQHFSK